ncbi:MAG: hypothetical protein K5892_00540 [Acholeplasmatales bacterium]|nr:hypothetical protein [Acholeplasmatales bacterium]
MKKRIIISLSILAVSIIAAVILIIVLTPKKDEEIEIKIKSFGHNYCEPVVLDLGKHKVKDYDKDKIDNEQYYIEFNIDSSEDFFNDYIKTNEGYIPELDFKVGECNHYGFLIIENNVFEYNVYDDVINLYACYGTFRDSRRELEFNSNQLYVLGDFNCNLIFSYLDSDESDSYHFGLRQSFTKVSYNDFIKIYNYIDSDICKVEDNVVYLKAFYDNNDGEMKLTDDYFVTISEVNGRPTLSRSNMLNEL